METSETNYSTEMPEVSPEPKKKSGAWKVLLAIAILLGVCGSTTVSAFTLVTLKGYIAKQEAGENTETTEDYVKIAEQYEILPTTAISDAYKSGDTSELDDKQKETLDMAKAALKEMKITDDMTEFEKEKAVYDWMTTSLQYDQGALTVIPSTQEDCDKPYGVLKYHNAVCVGYATTFRMFMQMLDIECMVEHNTEKYHSWNVVKIDGDWYITDVYSDAGDNTYAHFNMTDAMWSQQQSWDHDYFPTANSLKYNMAYQDKVKVDDIYGIIGALREAMDQKKGAVMISFEKEVTDEDAQIANAIAGTVDNILMEGGYADMPYCLTGYNWIQDPEDDSYIYCVYMSTYNSNTIAGNDLSEEKMTEIQEKVNEAFSGLTPVGMDASSMGGMTEEYMEQGEGDNIDMSEEAPIEEMEAVIEE